MSSLASARGRILVCLILLLALGGLLPVAASAEEPAEEPADSPLAERFASPPDSARPHTWWHWMNGNISKEGITADLEGMSKVGIGGAQIFNADCGIPDGPVPFMSDTWREAVHHAVREADRLGLELCLHNCAGWSSSGGPWITPEFAMQKVVWTECVVEGGTRPPALPQPETVAGYYRDIAVLAFPTPMDDAPAASPPSVSASSADVEVAKLTDNNPATLVALPPITPASPPYIQFDYSEPCTVRELVISTGSNVAACSGEVHVSDDGQTYRNVAPFSLPSTQWAPPQLMFPVDAPAARHFRVVFTSATMPEARIQVAGIELWAKARLLQWRDKAGFSSVANLGRDGRSLPAECAVRTGEEKDLTAHLGADGTLDWTAPPGKWTVVRLGYTPTGKTNHPAPKSGLGLECDKLSREAAELHWEHAMKPIIDDAGVLAGKSLRHVIIDSYEVGAQNWSPAFRDDFKRLRGYDPLPFLPALTGRIVEGVDQTERFLWDFRRTIADLFADNYYGHFRTMAHRAGLELSVEPYGNGGFDELTSGGKADIPMTEFWVGQGPDVSGGKLASSIAHTYGRKYVGAESFTASYQVGRWLNDPYSIKALGDLMYTGGVNRFIFHRYAHQPWLDREPGMTMGPWGMHLERTITWWDQGAAWLKYLARCQYLLQEGRFVADVCYFVGEDSPRVATGRAGLTPVLPESYDYDLCDATTLLTSFSVKGGELVLPSGMRYKVLALPAQRTMSPEVLRRIDQLVRAGATVVGPRPQVSPSLEGYPSCDDAVEAISAKLWGDCDGKSVTEHVLGKGRVHWGKPIAEVLSGLGVKPDFECADEPGARKFAYIHRTIGDVDVYFVANWQPRSAERLCTFRVQGRQPELWHADTGRTEAAPVFWSDGDRTSLPVALEPRGSVFVIFRKAPVAQDSVVAINRDGVSVFEPQRETGDRLVIRKAEYGALKDSYPGVVDLTGRVAELVRAGAVIHADNALAGGDPAPNVFKELRVVCMVAGQRTVVSAPENTVLALPQEASLEVVRAWYGALPADIPDTPTARAVDVTGHLAGLVRDGRLGVLASNALAGDPAPMVPKQLRIEYAINDVVKSKTLNENEYLSLPDDDWWSLPSADPSLASDGVRGLTVWRAGRYDIAYASGKQRSVDVAELPEPVGITGPWQVRFQPGRHAPESATFDKLISWTECPEPGIRYFSGTATYTMDFTVSDTIFLKDAVHMIDLGRLANLAQVWVNGQDLGVLWKPPYRVDVSRCLKAGVNHLEIAVTNLWPNRLIGDEQLPDDCEWNADGSLKKWPEWFLSGAPRPSQERCTFTTWKHYSKNEPLLESGLFGPVRLWTGRSMSIDVQ